MKKEIGEGIFKLVLRCLFLAFGTLHLAAWCAASAGTTTFHDNSEAIIGRVSTDEKVVALTFDDGPGTKYTPRILDLLSQYQAKATFFVVGWRVENYPDLILREDSDGHELGNHTFTHFNYRKMSTEQLIEEINKTQEAIFRVTGKRPIFFRPPGGYLSTSVKAAAMKEHLRIVNWSWDQETRDWSKPGVQNIVNKVLKNVHPGDIILFHDQSRGTFQTVQALKEILPGLMEKGYRCVTVSELLTYEKNRQNRSDMKWGTIDGERTMNYLVVVRLLFRSNL
ncbi:polysaccharide deacetylase family protein [Cohnella terricola]|uniref:Polysaccharide deacetylase family protein n=1 Tax=Cohnella terricola TaxID=1289167 RepID=A0A559JQL4_9BACL|nr:polysaccharide deacetylase family protein [Cohnella terricola]TVY02160.1 polysaccharide deacetylase family protein [Cohnella terricola]